MEIPLSTEELGTTGKLLAKVSTGNPEYTFSTHVLKKSATSL